MPAIYTWASGIPKVALIVLCDWHNDTDYHMGPWWRQLQNWPWNKLTQWILTVNSRCTIWKLCNRCAICQFFEVEKSCCSTQKTEQWVLSKTNKKRLEYLLNELHLSLWAVCRTILAHVGIGIACYLMLPLITIASTLYSRSFVRKYFCGQKQACFICSKYSFFVCMSTVEHP